MDVMALRRGLLMMITGGEVEDMKKTQIINNSSGNVCFTDVLDACEALNYTLTYKDCILFFRAKGANANSSPPNSYTYNNHTILIKDWAVWDVSNNRCMYQSGAKSPDSFNTYRLLETNNAIQNSGSIINANRNIVNTYASAFQAMGGSGTSVILMEIPVDWSDFLSTL